MADNFKHNPIYSFNEDGTLEDGYSLKIGAHDGDYQERLTTLLNDKQRTIEALRQRAEQAEAENARLRAELAKILGRWQPTMVDGKWTVMHPYYGLLAWVNHRHLYARPRTTVDGLQYTWLDTQEYTIQEAKYQNEFIDKQVSMYEAKHTTESSTPDAPADSEADTPPAEARYVVGRTFVHSFRVLDTETGNPLWQYTYKTEAEAQARADKLNASLAINITSTEPCPACGGMCEFPCDNCDGKGYTVGWSGNPSDEPYQIPCGACGTSGKYECWHCGGRGEIETSK